MHVHAFISAGSLQCLADVQFEQTYSVPSADQVLSQSGRLLWLSRGQELAGSRVAFFWHESVFWMSSHCCFAG